MKNILADLLPPIPLTGNIPQDASAVLTHHQCPHTLFHSTRVAAAAQQLAEQYNADTQAAICAGWLHDISAVIPQNEWIVCAEKWNIEILPEERQAPVVLHQKLSTYLARHLFRVTDPITLSAIECHTTLRPGASRLDKIVFLADKLEWDQTGKPPYKAELQKALQISLKTATEWYLTWMWQQRDKLLVIHPWFKAAYEEFDKVSISSSSPSGPSTFRDSNSSP
jgi:predicted HD superfamily hydrolase involved in NAD metabolism